MRRILILPLAIAAACGPRQSDVEVDWTFAGASCSQAGVASIRVDIANEVLSPNQFTCAEASLGADLGVYLVGDYQITITGMDADGFITHQVTPPAIKATATARHSGAKRKPGSVAKRRRPVIIGPIRLERL